MTKIEFIEKYGKEAYQRHLEQKKQYYQQHKEKRMEYQKQYNQQHKEEAKQYYQQHKEKIRDDKKQYYQQHKEERKQYNRQHKNMFAYCISEQIEQIENYESAKKDNFDGWHIHHRFETHNADGEKKLVDLSREELIAMDMYYNRPASELVFLTKSEHTSLHNRNRKRNKQR